MGAINAADIKREPVPPEVMIEVEEHFHSNGGYFFGLDRRAPDTLGLGWSADMRQIAREINIGWPSVVWVSFSKNAIEFGVNVESFDQALPIINSVCEILERHGYLPKRDSITYRS